MNRLEAIKQRARAAQDIPIRDRLGDTIARTDLPLLLAVAEAADTLRVAWERRYERTTHDYIEIPALIAALAPLLAEMTDRGGETR